MSASWSTSLYSTHGNDFVEWRKLVDKLPPVMRDVYYWPEYAALWEEETKEPARLFAYGCGDELVMNVFMRRSVKNLEFASGLSLREQDHFCDIVTPYGYGGPLVTTNDRIVAVQLWKEAQKAFFTMCREEGIVAEFVRLHPLIENHGFFTESSGLIPKNYTVWIDLEQQPEEILANIRSDHRKSIRRAQRNGVHVVRTEAAEDLVSFTRLYRMTMERLGALDSYCYSPDFFVRMYERLGKGISLFKAVWEGKVASAHLVIHSGDYIHNFFSGSDPELRHTRGDVLITYEIALWAREQGYRKFHLGGGHAVEQDSLLYFKSGFSPLKSPYYMCRRVCDEEAYATLCNLHSQTSLKIDEDRLDPVLRNYFPAYRI